MDKIADYLFLRKEDIISYDSIFCLIMWIS